MRPVLRGVVETRGKLESEGMEGPIVPLKELTNPRQVRLFLTWQVQFQVEGCQSR